MSYVKILKFFLLLIIVSLNAIILISCQALTPSQQLSATLSNEIILDWNRTTYQIAYEHDQFYSFIGVRALAMSHLAMHDVLNAIDPRYESYAFHTKNSEADIIAAISQAAYTVLVKAYPDRKDTLDFQLQKWLGKVPSGTSKDVGISLGKDAAEAIIQRREGDGHEKQGNYTPMTKPGDYQFTPEYDWVWIPDFSYARPFTLDSLTQFRSPPPPTLASEEYADSYNEVKAYGQKNSQLRTADQTHFAHWWAEFGEHGWNRIGRLTAKAQKLSAWKTNRMFALINMNLYDLYLVSFDSKYHYDTWRPYTAIRNGDKDNNPLTEADAKWMPEMLTPPWPEYPSAHAAVGAGGAEIVSHVYGTSKVSFTMTSTSALPEFPNRTYTDLDQAADDCADSRIMNGFHFRFATEEGKKQGRAVAKHVIGHYLRPLK